MNEITVLPNSFPEMAELILGDNWSPGSASLTVRNKATESVIQVWRSDRATDGGHEPTDWKWFTKDGELIHEGEGPTSGAQGWQDMGQALAHLLGFLSYESENWRNRMDLDLMFDLDENAAELLDLCADEFDLIRIEYEE